MPTRPIPPEDARYSPVTVRAGSNAPLFRRLAAQRGTLVSDLLRDLILDALRRQYGYADDTRREPSRPNKFSREPNPDSPTLSTALSPHEAALASDLAAREGVTVNAWLRGLVVAELAAAGIQAPPPPIVAAIPDPDQAKAAAIERLGRVDWPQDAATRNEKIRQLDADGAFAGLSNADIAHVIPGDLSRQRVALVRKAARS